MAPKPAPQPERESAPDPARAPALDPALAERARLAWRCRRGTRELDLLLQRWLQQGYAAASAPQRALFERLLELPDPQLVDYLLAGSVPTVPAWAELIEAIRDTPGALPVETAQALPPV